jgi:predicted dehydrogenase
VETVEDLLGLGVDIVSVCTPHPTHEAIVVAGAQAGAQVLCEKPVAVDLASGWRMVEVCRDAGVRFGGMFQRRFWPASRRIRDAIDDGTLGVPVMGQITALMHRAPEYYTRDAWRGTWSNDGGGVLMTQTVHQLDLLQWFMGRVVSVQGAVQTYRHGGYIEVEDSASAVLAFESGAMATVLASTGVQPNLGIDLLVTGGSGATAGLREFPEGAEGVNHVWAADGRIDETLRTPNGVARDVDLSLINAQLMPFHTVQIADFVAAVREDREPAVTGADGLAALGIVLAVYESARLGRPVDPADLVAAQAVQ